MRGVVSFPESVKASNSGSTPKTATHYSDFQPSCRHEGFTLGHGGERRVKRQTTYRHFSKAATTTITAQTDAKSDEAGRTTADPNYNVIKPDMVFSTWRAHQLSDYRRQLAFARTRLCVSTK